MIKKVHLHPSDIRGFCGLAVQATLRLTDLVEIMHHNIARAPGLIGAPTQAPMKGVTGLVYESVRGVARLLETGIDAILGQFTPLSHQHSSPEREALLAALNGVLGDYLADGENPLAISMRLRRNGQALELDRHALGVSIPRPSRKI